MNNNNIQSQKRMRFAGIDLLRVCAVLCVMLGHPFLYTEFDIAPYQGVSMLLQGMMLSFGLGVGLFLMLTGYLNCNKTFPANSISEGFGCSFPM